MGGALFGLIAFACGCGLGWVLWGEPLKKANRILNKIIDATNEKADKKLAELEEREREWDAR
jgi:hypothetical protein